MSHRRNLTSAVAITSLLACAGAALAADTSTPTQITVTPVASLQAGDTSPGDVPGVKAIRRNKVIPAGYVMIGQQVDVHRGSKTAGASLLFSCPGSKRLRSFLSTGEVGFQSDGRYANRHQAFISTFRSERHDISGILYAVCR